MNKMIVTATFYGTELYVIEHDGEPHVPMKPIVEGMVMTWQSQLEKLKQRKSTVTEIVIVASDGKERKMACLPLRKLAGWLRTIYPNKVKPEICDKVVQYQEECDDVLYEYWTKGQVTNPRKRSVMQELNAAWADLKTDKAVASVFGSGLNEWKGIRAAHAKKIKVLIEEAQLLLTF